GEPTTMSAGRFNGGVRYVPTVPIDSPVYCEVRFRLRTQSDPVLISNLRPFSDPIVHLDGLYVPGPLELPDPNVALSARCSPSPGGIVVGANTVETLGTEVQLCMWGGSQLPTLYQWRKDGVAISGTTLIEFNGWRYIAHTFVLLTNVQSSDAGCYTVLASNAM